MVDLTGATPNDASLPAAHGIRIRLLRLLLLIPPVLPIVQLGQVWAQFDVRPNAPYFATVHGTVVACWLVLAVIIGGLLQRRSRAGERRARWILFGTSAAIAVTGGVVVGAAIGVLSHQPARGDAAMVVALPGVGLGWLTVLGWPESGLGWVRRRARLEIRSTPLAIGIALASVGTLAGHLGDGLRQPRHSELGPVLNYPVVFRSDWLPFAFGLVAALGWLLICLAVRGPRARGVAFAFAAAAVVLTASLTNIMAGHGLIFAGYGVLPVAFAAASAITLRRQRTLTRTGSG